MKKLIHLSVVVLVVLIAMPAIASTVAYWRFEEGPAGADVALDFGATDSSGNGNHLRPWATGWAGFAYKAEVAQSTIPTTGEANNFSVKNTGSYPAMFTDSSVTAPTGTDLETWAPTQWTIEASFKPENGGHRTIVGRDAFGVATSNEQLAALYFQIQPDNSVAIKYADVQGFWHEAISAANAVQGFDHPTDPDGLQGKWYNMAAVCDGSTLSLYLADDAAGTGYQLVAQTDLTLSGSTDTSLTAGNDTDGNDWHSGEWSVGRGLYNGGHGDRAYGYIDEVRISDTALETGEFLMVPEPATLALFGLGALAAVRRRRAQ